MDDRMGGATTTPGPRHTDLPPLQHNHAVPAPGLPLPEGTRSPRRGGTCLPRQITTRCGRRWRRQPSTNAARVHNGVRDGSLQTAWKWKSFPNAPRRDRGDPHADLADVAAVITKPGGGYDKFRESKQLQAQRRAAQRMGQEGGAARTAWKAISRARKQEQRAWQQANVLRASQMDWRAKRTLDHHTAGRDGSTVSWTTATGRTSSGGISRASSFRTPQSSTAARLQDIRAALSKACKQHRWRPFTEEELRLATATWHRGKATGPDGISLEALMTLLQDVRWTDRLRYIFNDFLDRGSLPPAVQEGVTVLLPKTVGAPQTWGHEAHYAVLRGA